MFLIGKRLAVQSIVGYTNCGLVSDDIDICASELDAKRMFDAALLHLE